MIRIALHDGSIREIVLGRPIRDVATELDPRLGSSIVCASVNGVLHDARDRLNEDCRLTLHTAATPEGRAVLSHTAAHIAAHAVKRLFPSAALGRGPASADAFYHDFEFQRPFTRSELVRVETEIARIIEQDLPIERQEMSKGDARALLIRRREVLQLELLEEIDAPMVVLYAQGDHVDLCRGPHAPSTGQVPAVRLTGLAAAAWRDDPHAEPLHRIYGTLRPDPPR